ncbi:MAG: hypothetical protein KF780_06320 [Sphingomonas sp.]|nr:hypothetical protein [Sphingomonas sp.]
MKAYYIGAAALLLGTSALAGKMAIDVADPAFDAKPVAAGWSEGFGPVIDKGMAPTSEPLAYTGKGMDDSWAAADPPAQLDPADPVLTDDPAGTGAPVDTLDATTAYGEAAPVQTAALDLTPRPATHNYPACEPGPGDDSCIQLYEPGVEIALASWTGETGGFAGESTAFAMGGPDEAEEIGHEAPIETAMVDTADPAMPADEQAYEGMGGPIAETGYPPCSGAASDDRCIQLYERGVTGEGN